MDNNKFSLICGSYDGKLIGISVKSNPKYDDDTLTSSILFSHAIF